MTYIICLNELTAAYFVLLSLLGRKPYVLMVDPIFPPLRRSLQSLAERMANAGRAGWIVELCPELQHLWDYHSRIFYHDIFSETEDWQNDYYGFEEVERTVPNYAYGYKHNTCNYTKKMHIPFLMAHSALKSNEKAKVIGLPEDSVKALENYWKQSFQPAVKAQWRPVRLINFFIFVLVLGYSLAWVLSRLRPFSGPPEKIFFAADYIEDPRDMRLYQEVAEGGTVLLVVRNATKPLESHEELNDFLRCKPTDGRFTLMGMLQAMGFVLGDGLRLFWRLGDRPTALYYQVAAMPFRKAVLRAFFNRYHPQYFWGRDDYNVEHIFRREELHRVKGVSLGKQHSYSCYTNSYPMWRYISFDKYYVFGRAVYERYLKDTWVDDMDIISVGSFGATREDYAKRLLPRPKNILVMTSALAGVQEVVDIVRGLAAAFPDKKILLQMKKGFMDGILDQKFFNDCSKGLANVSPIHGKLYDIFTQASYAFSDPSSVIAEALEFGLSSFLIDILKEQKSCLYREFPGISVTSPEEAVERIRSIESGEWRYPREEYGELLDLSGKNYFDYIREDVGLPAKEKPTPLPGDG